MNNLTDLRLRLLKNGWHPLPVNGKRPVLPSWQKLCNEPPSKKDIINWQTQYAAAHSTGIAAAHLVIIDIDVASDASLAENVRCQAFDCFGATPFVRVGRAPKVALVYRAREDVRKRSFKAASGNGDGVDILSSGAQFVAFGLHPDTGQSYKWVGPASPEDASPDEAPAISNSQIEGFLERANSLVKFGRKSGQDGSNTIAQADRLVRDDVSGLVIDGREYFLNQCVWDACVQLMQEGEPLLANAAAELAWCLFTDPHRGADLSDGKWKFKHAVDKARGKVRKFNDGTVPCRRFRPTTAPTYADLSIPIQIARQTVRQAVLAHLVSIASYETSVQEQNWASENGQAERPVQR